MKKYFINLFPLLLFLLLTAQVLAGISDYSNGLTTAANIYETAKNLKAEDYPNSDSIIVNELTYTEYSPDGTDNTWNDCSTKIFTEKGREACKVMSFSFSENYSRMNTVLAEVIKADGSVVNVDIKTHSKIAIETDQMASNIYDKNSKVLKVNIPDLKIGDTVRCVVHSNLFKNPIPKTWNDVVLMEGASPIFNKEYTVKAPYALPLVKIALLDEIKGTVTFEKTAAMSGTTYHWTVKNVPRMFPEPQMPALSSVVQRLLVSTIPDWEFISKWYWELCKKHMEPTPEMKEKVQELIKNAKDDNDKIREVFDFVSQKIRYMGLIAEQESPGMEPHDVKLTFNNKYGVCRDKAVLLVEMLRLAGLEAYPVIIKVGPKLDKVVPIEYFNHAIACVELNGKTILMDPTNENTKDIFPAYLSNLSYLVAKPEGSTLQTSPVIPADKNLMVINTEGEFTEKNVLKATSIIECFGINDTIYRNALGRITPDQLEQLFDRILRTIIPSSEITKLEVFPKDLMNTDEQVKVVISYTADNEIIEGKNNAVITMPWIGNSLGFVNRVIQSTGLKERKYPLVTDITCGYKETLNLKIKNQHFNTEYVPLYKSVNKDIITFNQNVAVKNNDIKAESYLTVNVVEFSPEQYMKLKDILKQLEVERKKKLIFSVDKSSEDEVKADSEILNKNVDIVIDNPHSWTEKYTIERKILTYNGKKSFSEIKIPYNPVWEDVKILSGEVISKDGSVSKLVENEINIMDQGWVSSASRYPAGKILVANLPSVDIDSIVKYSYEKKVKNKLFFSAEAAFQAFSPIKNYTFSLQYPKDMELSIYKSKNDNIIETQNKNTDSVKYSWSVKDIPALKKISSLPPGCTFLPTVMISFSSWKDYSSKVLNAVKTKAENQNTVEKLTHEIIADKNSDTAKVTAIRDYVAKNIRFDGPGFGSLPIEYYSCAEQTLRDGYGNSMDKAILLYSMLSYAGFKPELVLASRYPYLNELVNVYKTNSQRHFFEDALIRVKVQDKDIYLNDTDEYSVLGSTAHENNIALDMQNGILFKIEPDKNKEDKIEVEYELNISDDGNAFLGVVKKYYGNIYEAKKESFDKMVPEERNRYYQARMAIISQLAEPATELYTDFNVYPGIEKYSANVTDYASIENNYFYFTLPLNLQYLFSLDGNTRDLPYFTAATQDIDFKLKIKLPEKYSEILISPESDTVHLPQNSGKISFTSVKETNNKYNYMIDIKIDPAIYSPDAYQELLKIEKKLSSPEIETYLLKKENPFMHNFDTPYGVPPFDKITLSDYMPAFEDGMKQQDQEIKEITDNKETPTFKNTVDKLEESGEILNRVASVFYNSLSVQNNKEIQKIAKEVSPVLSKHYDNIMLNKNLFERINTVYQNKEKENLNGEQEEVLKEYYEDFVRAGAALPEEKQAELKKINPELSVLYLNFADNVINEINSYKMYITDKKDLTGLPGSVISSAANAAEKDGHKGDWLFTVQKPSMIPFLQYADNRVLREKLMTAYHNLADNNNETDNKEIIKKIISLRTKKAHILGYKNFAEYIIANNMAKTVKAAYDMTMKVYEPALKKAREESNALQEMIYKGGENFNLEPWDWSYYAEKLRKEKFDIDERQLSRYFVLDNVVNKGIFYCANKLYGLSFEEIKNIPKPHSDAKAYKVLDKDKNLIGILYMDFFARASKRAGAWMSSYRKQSNLKKKVIPIITMVCNFAEPANDIPTLLTPDEVRTVFHEFGHSLHGLLSNCTYEKVSGTSVPRDYVELPSQIMENWAVEPEVLKNYAFNYKTGEIIPESAIEKLKKAEQFNQGFITTEVLSAALLDFAYHTHSDEEPIDNIQEFEKKVLDDIGLIPEIHVRYGGPYFNHIFSSEGYAAGYYVYNWGEVLSADAFKAFSETGNIFNPEKAALFKEWVLEKGGSGDVMKFYKNFRGKEPAAKALLEKKGLDNL